LFFNKRANDKRATPQPASDNKTTLYSGESGPKRGAFALPVGNSIAAVGNLVMTAGNFPQQKLKERSYSVKLFSSPEIMLLRRHATQAGFA
jgi:hypothetical protein